MNQTTQLSADEIAEAEERDDRSRDATDIAVLKSIQVTDAFDLVDEFRRDAESKGITVAQLCELMSVPNAVNPQPELTEPETEQESDEK